MIEVVDAVIIDGGQITHRAALCLSGSKNEIEVTHMVESWEEAIAWAKEAWSKRTKGYSPDDLKALGWINPEVRYWP